eukprot:CAMPEP_0197030906 /NCGR_PEP_ID=MMETSP1384-20130603/10035_1 /TAXON_ID=29189 /ORGANISM="Ammonia sp." /LENGTH=133 /DNA_ID=CAMNT_0042460339 /DNA_START=104 /DNA_END=505 /DNA_ORIENTATION=-
MNSEGAAPPQYNQVNQAQPQQVQYVQQPVYTTQPQQGTVQQGNVVVQATVVTNPNFMPRSPTTAFCPRCQANVMTQCTIEPGLGTWAICGGIALAGFCCGCCLIPFCIDDCKDVHHYCSKCNTLIGSRKMINM